VEEAEMAINETATGNDSVSITGTASAGERTIGVKGVGDSTGVHGEGKAWNGVEGVSQSTIGGSGVFGANTAPANFVASALAGDLPSVTFIDPDFIDFPPGFDDDAPADIARGQHFIGTIANALIQGPLWSRTLFIITYDEHGGFYDHVPPPAAIPVSAIDHYGVRVPAFVVSPWVTRSAVSGVVFDHTSIAKTITRRFMSAYPLDMGERMAKANDLSSVLRKSARQDRPQIPVPADPTPDSAMQRLATTELEGDDFKGLLHSMRTRYPVGR
jgi:hypothetical protein